tara:strand:+ start:17738 stop:18817 length:1080 start_codon:yes stop_codon:yes gene_type:complete
MTVTASKGAFGWGCQAAKGTAAQIDYWHRAHNIDLGVVESREVLDPEVGGTILPTGVIKTGVHAAGGVDISPRLEDDIGWLFMSLMGSVTTTGDTPEQGTAIYTHEFSFTNLTTLPWLTLAKMMPGSSAAEDIGLRVTDAKTAAMRLMLPGRGRLRARMDFLGITPEFVPDADTLHWDPAYEEEDSIPITSKPGGGFHMPTGTPVYPLGCTVDMTNGLSNPVTQEAVIGSYYPDDIALLGRAVIIRFPLKISNYDVWSQAIFNVSDASAAGQNWVPWSPITYSTTWFVRCESPGSMTGESYPWALELEAAEVEWVVDPIALVGNQQVLVNVTGTVVQPASGTAFKITLVNLTSSYAWPS